MNHGYSMILVLILMMAVAGCKRASNKQDIETLFVQHEKNLVSEVHYAEGFDVYRLTGATRIVVYHSGDKARGSDDFFIVDKDIAGQYRDSSNVFTGPPHDAAVFSATQLNAFEKLGILDKVVGISEAAYINNPFIREQVEKGNIAELAGNGNFFAEKTLIVNPSVIFYTPYSIDNLHALDITKIPRYRLTIIWKPIRWAGLSGSNLPLPFSINLMKRIACLMSSLRSTININGWRKM